MRLIDRKWIKPLTSLRLTVGLLACALVLVFIGTLAQVEEGLYQAQARYFKSFFIYWTPSHSSLKIPVFPGGYFIGSLLLLNLLAAHALRFQLTRKKIGIFCVHLGVILLLLGQVLTDVLSLETHMRLTEHVPKNYTEHATAYELAVVDTSGSDFDQVVVFPESFLKNGQVLAHADLPFQVRVETFYPNSKPELARTAAHGTPAMAQQLEFFPEKITRKMTDKNIPAATVEIMAAGESLGRWAVAGWLTEAPLRRYLRKRFGELRMISEGISFPFRDRNYRLELRPIRHYQPYTIELLRFTHELYKGTDIPKNFASRLRLSDPQQNEKREVEIYMNNPLRYRGETFYQGGFDELDPRVSILQVVRNPSWLAPYFACGLVAAGLIIQFLTHLIPFIKRKKP